MAMLCGLCLLRVQTIVVVISTIAWQRVKDDLKNQAITQGTRTRKESMEEGNCYLRVLCVWVGVVLP